jgi:hypothetical protein
MWRVGAVGMGLAAVCCPGIWAQPLQASAPGGIYSCTTADGQRLTSDRPIPACNAREQRILNRDGSLRGVHPPSLTAEERAEREAVERRAQAERLALQDAIRRDRNLVARFPNEAAHRKAREASLDTVRLAIRATEMRITELATERRPLSDEAEFFKGRALPPRLKQQLDANDVAVEAQRSATQNQQAELARINRLYDAELERLKKLWAGAPAGSLGPGAQGPAGGQLVGDSKPARK